MKMFSHGSKGLTEMYCTVQDNKAAYSTQYNVLYKKWATTIIKIGCYI